MPNFNLGPVGGDVSPDPRLAVALESYRSADTPTTVRTLTGCWEWNGPDDARTRALTLLGMAEFELGRLSDAFRHLKAGVEAARSIDTRLYFESLFALFVREADFQDPDESLKSLTQLRQLAASNGDNSSIIGLHLAVARLDGTRGHVAEAQRHIGIADRLVEGLQAPALRCLTSLVEASIRSITGSPLESHERAKRALEEAIKLQDLRLELHAYSLLAHTSLQAGDLKTASSLGRTVVDGSKNLNPVRIAALDTLAQASLAAHEPARSATYLTLISDVAPSYSLGRLWNDIESDITRCHVAEADGNWTEVLRLATAAEPDTRRRHLHALRVGLLCAQARALAQLDRLEAAELQLDLAARALPEVCLDQLVILHASRGVHALIRGSLGGADQHFDRALVVARSTGRTTLGHWVENTRAQLPSGRVASTKTELADGVSKLERIVTTAADLQEAAGSADLLVGRVVELLRLAGFACRVERERVRNNRVNSDVKWSALRNVFKIAVDHQGEDIVFLMEGVHGLDQMSFLATVADILRGSLKRSSGGESRELWPQAPPTGPDGVVFQSRRMQELLGAAGRLASANLPVLITGETGTGKEVLARLIHETGPQRRGAYVPFNCAALPRELVESQLFGHRRGAFTGAVDSQLGIIRAAQGGTLFLDEIGDLDRDVQPKLLRFLENGEVHPVGEARAQTVSLHVVAATNVDLQALVEQGRFREDLFYRISVAPICIPPLRQRKDEIPALAAMFADRFGRECKRTNLRLSDEFVAALLLYDWPGNIRQLANEIRRTVALASDGDTLRVSNLAPQISQAWTDRPAEQPPRGRPGIMIALDQDLSSATAELESRLIEHALDVTDGHVSDAARLLGLSRKGLFLKRRRRGLLAGRSG